MNRSLLSFSVNDIRIQLIILTFLMVVKESDLSTFCMNHGNDSDHKYVFFLLIDIHMKLSHKTIIFISLSSRVSTFG